MRRIHLLRLAVLVFLVAGVGIVQSVGATTGSASIEVRKALSPSTDPGKFNLIVRHTGGALITQASNVGNGGHTSRVTISAGQHYTVEELAGTNSNLSNYTSSLDCYVVSGPDAGKHFTTNGTGWAFIATAGDKYTCTFTNTRKSN
jgi:hypothetical protein